MSYSGVGEEGYIELQYDFKATFLEFSMADRGMGRVFSLKG